MNTTQSNPIKGVWSRLKETLRERNRKLLRSIEYKRLKRIRKKSVPSYRYCKNCGTELTGMYCSQCGQYALDSEQPFWKYIVQYFENMYSFDGKVWITVWTLLRHPGMLTKEFNAGKISSYVHPMKLFMSFSVIFFLFALPYFNQQMKSSFMEDTTEDILYFPFLMIERGMIDGKFQLDSIDSNNMTMSVVTDDFCITKYPNTFKILAFSASMDEDSIYQDTIKVRAPKEVFTLPCWKLVGEWNGATLVQVDTDAYNSFIQSVISVPVKIFEFINEYGLIIILLLIPVLAKIIQLSYRKSHVPYIGHCVFSLHIMTAFEILLAIYVIVSELWEYDIMLFVGFILLYLTHIIISSKVIYERSWLASIFKTIGIFFCYYLIVLIVLLGLAYPFAIDMYTSWINLSQSWGQDKLLGV